ncbi:putative serine protease EDA2 [Podospora fimiseda]|uniref:Serine protease EDA2 n=1 Tax=Podospora fimiseda TaxID=252190 RepID=A0AAN7GQK7_9PEZI|nr:putative serine protease EDA2 [Podospora fimiseda]
MKTLTNPILLLGVYSFLVQAIFPQARLPVVTLGTSQLRRPSKLSGSGNFSQRLNHSDPSAGTFNQQYIWNTEYWGGPGSPVILYNHGESPSSLATDYLSNDTLVGLYAQALNAAMVMIEHRYWGKSSPFQVLDTQNLTHLTLNNSIHDMTYFARNVRLPFDLSGDSNAPKAPWVLVGGSYAGALSAWTSKISPGTFWAHHASSAPVQVIGNFWQYFEPIRAGMPQNCSLSFELIAEHIDDVLAGKNSTEILELKKKFLLQDLVSDADFASAISLPLGMWQSILAITLKTEHPFYQMCDTVQGVRPVEPYNPNGDDTIGEILTARSPPNLVDHTKEVVTVRALNNYAAWWNNEYFPGSCASWGYPDWNHTFSSACYDTLNTSNPQFTDLAVSNINSARPWAWLLCNEPFGWWQGGAPPEVTSLISRAVNVEYLESICHRLFPQQGTAQVNTWKIPESINLFTDGWHINTTRVLFVDGEFDPWRSASISSDFRDDGPFQSTTKQPVLIVKGGRHGYDLDAWIGERVEEIGSVQRQAVTQMVKWVQQFYDIEERHKSGWEWLKPCKRINNTSSCGGNLWK